LVRSLAESIRSKKLYYSALNNDEEGALYDEKQIIFRYKDSSRPGIQSRSPHSNFRIPASLDLSRFKLAGRHNLENACAAALAALAAGGQPDAIQGTLNQYRGSAHRMESVATIDGIDFYNDSKATNVAAVMRAVECFSQPVLLIMGGLDKSGNFTELRKVVSRHVKKLFVMGQAADLIRSALGDTVSTATVVSMQDATQQAFQDSSPGDVVLLSPGCASFDMYDNYAQRGNDFKESVAMLKRKNPA